MSVSAVTKGNGDDLRILSRRRDVTLDLLSRRLAKRDVKRSLRRSPPAPPGN